MVTLINNNIFNIVLVIFVIIVASKLYFDSDSFNLRCVISDVNGNKYCVRDRNKLELAADRLANVNNNLNKLVNHLAKKYPDKENVKRLVKGYNPKKINNVFICWKFLSIINNKRRLNKVQQHIHFWS